MLSVSVADDQSLQMFHTQDALFAENAGQWDSEEVYFGYNKGGTQIYFTNNGLDFGLSRTVNEAANPLLAESLATELEPFNAEPEIESTQFSLSFDGATPTVPVGADQAVTKFNYHLGTQENWVDGVSTYKTVVYNDLYSGINLETFSLHGQMKYEFHVDPDADYTQIELSYTSIEGLSIGPDGSLHIATELGEIVDEDLYIYQMIDGTEVEITGQFTLLDADTYTFTITGDYDPTTELVIDPNIDWGSYLGGSGGDIANGVSTDTAGNIYVCGRTIGSRDWEIAGGWDTSFKIGHDGYVVKLDPRGAHLWSTYLGGSSSDYAYGVSTDPASNVYICGMTYSSDWGITGGWDTSNAGGYDGYVVKLDSSGANLWGTYLGGSSWDSADNVSTDATGNVYVCGATGSSDWNITGGWDTSFDGSDGYVVKLDSDGNHIWSTYLGGRGSEDSATDVSTDVTGNVYVCGYTSSSTWGITGGWNISHGGGPDGYAIKFNSSGTHLWSTYLGGSNIDYAWGINTDTEGNVCVCGTTGSSDWNITGGWNSFYNGNQDGYVVKLNASGDHLWSTYLGGSGEERSNNVSTDAMGNVYVCGYTESSNWGIVGGWNTYYGGNRDSYLVKLQTNGNHLWSTYLGGNSYDSAYGVSTDAMGNAYVCGWTESSGWGIADGWDTSYGGNSDGYIIKIDDQVPGDANGDGRVDGSDVTILAGNWQAGVSDGQTVTWAMGDFNGDGKVDGSDVTILAGNWQAGVSAALVAVSTSETAQTRQFVPPATASLGMATVLRRESLPTHRFISPTPESTDAVLVESTWSSNEITAVAKDLMPISVKKSTAMHDELFALELDPYADLE